MTAAFIMAAILPMTQFESFLILIGSFFVPLLGGLLADHLVVRRGQCDQEALFDGDGPYRFLSGFNLAAIAVWVLGIALYMCIAGLPLIGLEGRAEWLGATLPTLAATFALHALIGTRMARR